MAADGDPTGSLQTRNVREDTTTEDLDDIRRGNVIVRGSAGEIGWHRAMAAAADRAGQALTEREQQVWSALERLPLPSPPGCSIADLDDRWLEFQMPREDEAPEGEDKEESAEDAKIAEDAEAEEEDLANKKQKAEEEEEKEESAENAKSGKDEEAAEEEEPDFDDDVSKACDD